MLAARVLARRLPRSLGCTRAYSGHGIVPPSKMGLELRRRVAAMEGLFKDYTAVEVEHHERLAGTDPESRIRAHSDSIRPF